MSVIWLQQTISCIHSCLDFEPQNIIYGEQTICDIYRLLLLTRRKCNSVCRTYLQSLKLQYFGAGNEAY